MYVNVHLLNEEYLHDPLATCWNLRPTVYWSPWGKCYNLLPTVKIIKYSATALTDTMAG